jgi:hypothetical protein
MPSVPRYESRIQQSATPNVKSQSSAPDAAFGASEPLFKLGAQMGEAVYKIGKEEYDRANDMVVLDAYGEALKRKNDRLLNPDTGLVTFQGERANGAIDHFSPLYQQDLDEIEQGLHNADQKAAFQKYKAAQMKEFNNKLQAHTFTETSKLKQIKVISSMDNISDDAALDFRNRQKLDQSREQVLGLSTQLAYEQGLPKEAEDQLKRQNITKYHNKVISQMMSSDDPGVKDYFNKYKSEMDPDEMKNLKDKIENGSKISEAYKISDSLVSKHKTIESAMSELSKMGLDGEIRDAVTPRLEREFRYRSAAQKKAQDQVFLDMQMKVDAGYIPTPNDFGNLTPAQAKGMKSYMKPFALKDDPEVASILNNMDAEDLSTIAPEDLAGKRNKLTRETYQKMWQRIQIARKYAEGDAASAEQATVDKQKQQIKQTAMQSAGVIPKGKTINEAVKTGHAQSVYNMDEIIRVEAAELTKLSGKKEPDVEIYKKAADNAAKRYVMTYKNVKDATFGSSPFAVKQRVNILDATKEDADSAFIPIEEVDPAFKTGLKDWLNKKGKIKTRYNNGTLWESHVNNITERAAAKKQLGMTDNEIAKWVDAEVAKIEGK